MDRSENETRRILRVRRLGEEDRANDLEQTSPAERLAMVWPLTVTAWTFKERGFAQSRLQRHIVRLRRREG
ncbi:hypothetical protein [Rhodocaloribacter sp.]